MTDIDSDRRKIVMTSGAALTIALAGCSGDGGGDDGGSDLTMEDHLSDANKYDGEPVDMTGESEITIKNGTNEPDWAFEPAAVKIDAGTTVTWEWVSDGHTVTSVGDPTFGAADELKDTGNTEEHTFEDAGTYLYQCRPHAALGQKGAVVVE